MPRHIFTEAERVLVRARMEGLDEWQTGGGCTALGRMGDEGSAVHHVLVTESDDPTVPQSLETPVTVGWYKADGFALLQVTFPHFAEAIEAIDLGIDSIPSDLLPTGPNPDAPEMTAEDFWKAERYQGGTN